MSKISAAAVEVQGQDEMFAAAGSPVLLRQQAAQVLAAHRSRRQRVGVDDEGVVVRPVVGREGGLRSRSQAIASRVTERYAQTPSYGAYLAAEAEEATRKARASAEVAARSAAGVAAAQRELLAELAMAEAREREFEAASARRQQVRKEELTRVEAVAEIAGDEAVATDPPASAAGARGGLIVRLFEDVGHASRSLASRPGQAPVRIVEQEIGAVESEEARALDEEISFRQSPTFDLERSSVSIPANLLEFPRQLVAARKARPSYALGPLGEDGQEAPSGAQLRIFEVDAAEITSAAPVESSGAEWSSIWLDALTTDAPEEALEEARIHANPRIVEAASIESRMMASLVDACLIGMGFVGFATVFAYNVAVLPSPAVAAVSGAGVLLGIILLYQMLFFTLSEATPGMRYARIGLCTFDDENPGRSALLRRTFATLLAAFPLGLGLLWAGMDEDGLGWHDRMSGMYQRSY